MAVVFLKIGQDVHFFDGDLTEAVNDGVRRGYTEGFLRKSVVGDPLLRQNTGDNTPAILHCSIVPGNQVEITVAPKGFGSENMSRIFMLKPADGTEALTRETGAPSELPHVCALEAELLERINALQIGPAGLGGNATALAVHINTYATHIAGLPLAVNLCCHVNRHASRVL